MKINVHRAEPSDASWILSQLKAFASFYGARHAPLQDMDHAAQCLSMLIENHIVLVAKTDVQGEQTGVIGGTVAPHPFCPDLKVCTGLFFWVPESRRGGRTGSLLLREFDRVASERADWVVLSLIAGKSPISDRMYQRLGYRLAERSYLKEVS